MNLKFGNSKGIHLNADPSHACKFKIHSTDGWLWWWWCFVLFYIHFYIHFQVFTSTALLYCSTKYNLIKFVWYTWIHASLYNKTVLKFNWINFCRINLQTWFAFDCKSINDVGKMWKVHVKSEGLTFWKHLLHKKYLSEMN